MTNVIQQLKDNEKPFGLMSEEMQVKARGIEPPGNFLFFTPYRPNGGIEWAIMAGEQNELHNHFTYRLRADYAEKPEIVECEVYTQKSQRQGFYIIVFDFGDTTGLGLAQYPDGYTRVGFKFEDGTVFGKPVKYSVPGITSKGYYAHYDDIKTGQALEHHATAVLFRRTK